MIERVLGQLLRGLHAGEGKLAWNDSSVRNAPAGIALKSSAFTSLGAIPQRFAGTGEGDNVSPPLTWSNLPPGTRGLVLIVEDPDVPLTAPFVHAIATGLDIQSGGLLEGAMNGEPGRTIQMGRNSFGRRDYAGPRALRGHGPHRYVFQLLALGKALALRKPPSKRELLSAIAGTVIGRGRLDGIYQRD
jgi:hypothetical protein